MSLWTRIVNVFRQRRVTEEIDEELRSHIEEAAEAGRDPAEAMRAFGSALRHREASLDTKLVAWLDTLRSDAVFGSRMLAKHKTHTAASVLSLALTIGACTAAFRLIDAVLLRPLPVASPDRLYVVNYEYLNQNGKPDTSDIFEYPTFRQLRDAVRGEAELMAITPANRSTITYGSGAGTERACRQYVSGVMFEVFGLQPAIGRLLSRADDVKPGGHPYAVLSYDYWTRRFGRDPDALGRTFRMGDGVFEIVGVAPAGFTGTDPGTLTDIYVPTMMNAKAIDARDWGWFRTWVRLGPGASRDSVRSKLAAAFTHDRRERTRAWADIPRQRVNAYINAPLFLEPAAAGVSGLQRDYRQSLLVLGALVALLLLIACVNVANLMLARAAARSREMALRVSIGAGRGRLVRMILVESAIMATLATVSGALLAWWAAPFVASMINPPDNPVRLILPVDLRVFGFIALLTAAAAFLFGLAPALRASGVKPMEALRGGHDPRSRRRGMNALVALQVAFCFLVSLVAGLFAATFDRLKSDPVGFSSDRVLTLEIAAQSGRPDSTWEQVERHLREAPGVDTAALCGWPLLSGTTWIFGMRTTATSEWDPSPPYLLNVSPGWFETMRIPLLAGRDFRPEDIAPHVAIVNETFARRYYEGQNPVGRTFQRSREGAAPTIVRIVGWVADAKYLNVREAVRPTAYVPFRSIPQQGQPKNKEWATLVIRTARAEPTTMAAALSKEVQRAAPGFRVVNVRTQREIVDSHTVRERLLATLSVFFALVALALAGVGLHGVLNYSVEQRRREIGIRMALGARAGDVATRVTAEVFAMLILGAVGGLAAGIASERFIGTLLYQVRLTEWTMLIRPAVAITIAGVLAALPPVIRAVRVDPARVLRTE